MVLFVLSVACLGLISTAKALLQPIWYELVVVAAAGVLAATGWRLSSLKSAEHRLYAEVQTLHVGQ
jgi:hypothetical protein